MLLITFPPSKNFETYLQSFIQNHTTQQEGRVDVMAKYCQRRLTSISKKGPRGKPPMIAEIETASVSQNDSTRPSPTCLFTACYPGRRVQPVHVRRVTRRYHPAPRAQLSTSENPHHPSVSCGRHFGAGRHQGGRHIPRAGRQ